MKEYTYFSEQRLREIERKIERLIRQRSKKIQDPDYIYLDNSEFCQLLNIGISTARNWRAQNLIPHSLVKHKLYYKLSDVEKMISNHRRM